MFGNKRYRATGAAAVETITIEVTPPEDGEDHDVISNKVSKNGVQSRAIFLSI